jgi:hypothetical protein
MKSFMHLNNEKRHNFSCLSIDHKSSRPSYWITDVTRNWYRSSTKQHPVFFPLLQIFPLLLPLLLTAEYFRYRFDSVISSISITITITLLYFRYPFRYRYSIKKATPTSPSEYGLYSWTSQTQEQRHSAS